MNPGAMMMAAMPKPEFIVAASIDSQKWLKLKAALLAMGMGLAMMQGYSITEKDNFLLIASKDHLDATQSGSVKNPGESGSSKEIFANNDFVLKINIAPILKMDLPIPPGGPMEILKDISHLESYPIPEKLPE